MNKKEYSQALRQTIIDMWGGDELAESQRSSYIWMYKLMNEYSDNEILGCAEWMTSWCKPRNVAQLYFSMNRYLQEQKKVEDKKRWQF